MLEQHGDVVYEVRASTITLRRDTARSALARAAAVALLFLSLWLSTTGASLASIVAVVGMLASLLAGHRWMVEERHPRPRTKPHRRRYVMLRSVQSALFLVFLIAFVGVDRDGDAERLWIPAVALIVAGALNLLAIEPALRRLFAQVAAERAGAA